MALRTDDANIPNLDVTIDTSDVRRGTKEILAVIRKEWDIEKVHFKRCGIGFVNYVTSASRGQDKVIFRIYGSEYTEILDKDQEKASTLLLNELGIGPRVLCVFKNGICFEYLEGLIFHWGDFSAMDDIEVASAFARELAKFHSKKTRDLAVSNKYNMKPSVFSERHLKILLDMYPTKEQFQDEKARDLFEQGAPSKTAIAAEIDEVQKMVQEMNLPVVFCHNDANATNSIYNRESGKCTLIDYDLTGFGHAEFDLAYFFTTLSNDLFAGAPPTSPRRQEGYRKELLLEYLKTRCRLDGEDENQAHVRLERCYAQVWKMTLASTLVFAIYCIIDATLSELHYGTPVEYMRTALKVYDKQYVQCKRELMELSVPELPQ